MTRSLGQIFRDVYKIISRTARASSSGIFALLVLAFLFFAPVISRANVTTGTVAATGAGAAGPPSYVKASTAYETLALHFVDNGSGDTFTQATISFDGTPLVFTDQLKCLADDSTSGISIFRDVNQDQTLDAGDTRLSLSGIAWQASADPSCGDPALTADTVLITIDPASDDVSPGATQDYLIVIQTDSDLADTGTFTITVGANQLVTTNGGSYPAAGVSTNVLTADTTAPAIAESDISFFDDNGGAAKIGDVIDVYAGNVPLDTVSVAFSSDSAGDVLFDVATTALVAFNDVGTAPDPGAGDTIWSARFVVADSTLVAGAGTDTASFPIELILTDEAGNTYVATSVTNIFNVDNILPEIPETAITLSISLDNGTAAVAGILDEVDVFVDTAAAADTIGSVVFTSAAAGDVLYDLATSTLVAFNDAGTVPDTAAADNIWSARFGVASAAQVLGGGTDTASFGIEVAVTDDAGNSFSATSTTNTLSADNIPISIVDATEFDVDGDGNIDEIAVEFSGIIDDSSISPAAAAQFSLDGVSCVNVDSITNAAGLTTANTEDPDAVNDTFVTIFTDDTSVTGTGLKTVSFTTAAGAFTDDAGNPVDSVAAAAVIDKAAPVMLSLSTMDDDRDGAIDIFKATVSEPVADTSFDNLKDSASTFTLTGALATPASEADVANDEILYIGVVESPANTGVVGDYTAGAGLITDNATAPVPMAAILPALVLETDGAPPIIVQAEAEAGSDSVNVVFSENIYNAAGAPATPGGDLNAADITYTDNVQAVRTISSFTAVAGTNSGTLTLSSAVSFANDLGVDTVAPAAGAVFDSSDNIADTAAGATLQDTAAPTILQAVEYDMDGDGNIDEIVVQFSEFMSDASISAADASQFTAGGAAAVGVDDVTDAAGTACSNPLDPQVTNDDYITIFTDDAAITGTTALNVTFITAAGRFQDSGGNDTPSQAVITEVDKAAPAYASSTMLDVDEDGRVDAIQVQFSEDIQNPGVDTANWTVANAPSGGTLSIAARNTSSTMYLTLNEGAGAQDTAVGSLQFSYDKNTASIKDAANNETPALALTTPLDGARPVMLAAATMDSNTDGSIDMMKVTLSEAVTDAGFNNANWAVSDTSAIAAALQNPAGDVADDNIIYLGITPTATNDTDLIVQTYDTTVSGSALQDAAGNTLVDMASGGITETDGAPPVVTSAALGNGNGVVTVTFTEAVTSTGVTRADINPAVTGDKFGTNNPAVVQASNSAAMTFTLDMNNTDAVQFAGTDVFNFSGNEAKIVDSIGLPLATAAGQPVMDLSADAAPPDFLNATLIAANQIQLTFSEPVDLSTAAAGDFSVLNNGAPVSVSSISSLDAAATITIQTAWDLNQRHAITVEMIATGSLGDLAGNILNNTNDTPVTVSDNVAPQITAQETADLDGDGYLDAIRIIFNEFIKDSSVTAANFDVQTVGGESFVSTTNGDLANNDVLYITFTPGAIWTTGDTPAIQYTMGTLTDLSGNLLANNGPAAASDKASPTVRLISTMDSNSDGTIDMMKVTLSEAVTDAGFNNANWAVSDTSVIAAALQNPAGDVPNDNVIYLGITASVSGDTDLTGEVYDTSVTGSSMQDPAGNTLANTASGDITETDGAPPALIGSSIQDSNASGFLNSASFRFSETLAGANEIGDWTLTDSDGTTDLLSGLLNVDVAVSGATVTITLADNTGTTGPPSFTYTLAGADNLQDTSANNALAIGSTAIPDTAPPVIKSVYSSQPIAGGNVQSGTIFTITFSENVNIVPAQISAVDFSVANGSWHGGATVVYADGATSTITATLSTSTTTKDWTNAASFDRSPAPLSNAGSIEDAAGNDAIANGITDPPIGNIADTTNPSITAMSTMDDDGDGRLDAIKVTFSENVDDSSFTSAAGWSITGGLVYSGTLHSPVTSEVDTPDDNIIYVGLAEAGFNTGLLPDATTDATVVLEDLGGGNTLAITNSVAISETDGAKPVMVAAATMDSNNDGTIDMMKVTLSENVTDSDFDNSKWAISDTSAIAAALQSPAGDAADDNVIYIGITPDALKDTDLIAQVYDTTVTGGALQDAAANTIANCNSACVSETDGAAPVIINTTAEDTDADGYLNLVAFGYSEALSGTNEIGDWTLVDADGATDLLDSLANGAVSIAGATVTITLTDATGTTGPPAFTYSLAGVDNLADTAASPNQALAVGSTGVADHVKPVVRAIRIMDDNGNGAMDMARVTLSESVIDATFTNTGWGISDTSALAGALVSPVTEADVANDNVIYVGFTPDVINDTDLITEVYDTTALGVALADAAGNTTTDLLSGGISETDGAPPALIHSSAQDTEHDGFLNTVALGFSENITGINQIGDWALTDADTSTNLLAGLNDTAVALSGATVTITLANTSGTTGSPSATYSRAGGDNIRDAAANQTQDFAAFVTDNAPPVIMEVYGSPPLMGNNLKNGTVLTITFSEDVSVTPGDVAAADFSVAGGSWHGGATVAYADGVGSAITAALSSPTTSSDWVNAVSFDRSGAALSMADSIEDAAGNDAVANGAIDPLITNLGLYTLRVNVEDELGNPLTGASVSQNGGSLVSCLEDGATGYYYCPVPDGETTAVTVEKSGFITESPGSAGPAVLGGSQVVQDMTDGTGNELLFTLKAIVEDELGSVFTGGTVAQNGGSAVPCAEDGSTGVYYCAAPSGETSALTAAKGGFVTRSKATVGNTSAAGPQITQDLTDGSGGEVQFTLRTNVQNELGAALSGALVTQAGGSAVGCTEDGGTGQYYCAVPEGETTAISVAKSGYITALPASAGNAAAAGPQRVQDLTDATGVPVQFTLRANVQHELGLSLPGATVAQTGGSAVGCAEDGGTGQYYCAIPDGEATTISVAKSGYITALPASAGNAAAAGPQRVQDLTDATGVPVQFTLRADVEDEQNNITNGATVAQTGGSAVGCTEDGVTGQYYCAIPDGEATTISVVKSGFVTALPASAGNAAEAGPQRVQNMTDGSGNELLFTLKAAVEDELGNILTGGVVTQNGGSAVSCIEDGATGIFYCPVPNGETTAITSTQLGYLTSSPGTVGPANAAGPQLLQNLTDTSGQEHLFQIRANSGPANLEDVVGNALNYDGSETVAVCTAADCSGTEAPIRIQFDGTSWYVAPATQGNKWIRVTKNGYVATIDGAASNASAAGPQVHPAFDNAAGDGLGYLIKVQSGAAFLEDELGSALTLDGTESITVCTAADCSATEPPDNIVFDTNAWYIAPATIGNKWIRIQKSGFLRTVDAALVVVTTAQVSPAFTQAAGDGLQYTLKSTIQNELAAPLTGASVTANTGATACIEDGSTPGDYYCPVPGGQPTDLSVTAAGLISTSKITAGNANELGVQIVNDILDGSGDEALYTVRANVEDELGNPFTGATVVQDGGSSVTCVEDAASGQYYCPVPDSQTTALSASKAGFVTHAKATGGPADVNGAQIAHDMTDGTGSEVRFTLRVNVQDELGNALTSATVSQNGGSNTPCAQDGATGQYYCAVPNGETTAITVSQSNYVTKSVATTGPASTAGPQAVQNMTDGTGNEVRFTLRVNVQDELGNALTAATVLQNGGSNTPCVQDGATGQYYCAVPNGETTAVTVSHAGYVTRNKATAGNAAESGSQVVQSLIDGSGSEIQFTLRVNIEDELAHPFNAAIVQQNGGSNTPCNEDGTTGQYYCAIPNTETTAVTVLKDGFITKSMATAGAANESGAQIIQNLTDGSGNEIQFTLRVDIEDELGNPFTAASVQQDGGSNTLCDEDGATGQYYCAVPDGETTAVTVSKTSFETQSAGTLGPGSVLGPQIVQDLTDGSGTEIRYTLRVNVQDELGAALTGASVQQNGGSAVTCLEDGVTGQYYCPIPDAQTTSVTVNKTGFVTRSMATVGPADEDGLQLLQNMNDGSGSEIRFTLRVNVQNELGGTFTLAAVQQNGGSNTPCAEDGATGQYYCAVPNGETTAVTVSKPNFVTKTVATAGPATEAGTQTVQNMTDGTGNEVQFTLRVNVEDELGNAFSSATVQQNGGSNTPCAEDGATGQYYCAVPNGETTAVTVSKPNFVTKTVATAGPATEAGTQTVQNMTDGTGNEVQFTLRVNVEDELGNAFSSATVQQNGGSNTACTEDGSTGQYYCAVPNGETTAVTVTKLNYETRTAATAGPASVAGPQVIQDLTDGSGNEVFFTLKVTIKDQLDNNINITDLDSILFDGIAPQFTDGANTAYWAREAANASLAIAKNGFVNAGTTHAGGFTNITTTTALQTQIVMGDGNPVIGAPLAGGGTINAKGLEYAYLISSVTTESSSTDITAPPTVLACGDETANNSCAFSTGTWYCPVLLANSNGTMGCNVLRDGFAVRDYPLDTGTPRLTGADAQLSDSISDVLYGLKVTLRTELGSDIAPASMATLLYAGNPSSYQDGVNTAFWADTTSAGQPLAASQTGYVNTDVTNMGLAAFSVSNTAQTHIDLGSATNTHAAIGAGGISSGAVNKVLGMQTQIYVASGINVLEDDEDGVVLLEGDEILTLCTDSNCTASEAPAFGPVFDYNTSKWHIAPATSGSDRWIKFEKPYYHAATDTTAIVPLPSSASVYPSFIYGVDPIPINHPPWIVAASTMDDNRDGQLDALKVTLSEAVRDHTFSGAGWSLSGGLTVTGALFSPTTESDTASDTIIYVAITGPADNTGVVPEVLTTSAETLRDYSLDVVNTLAPTLSGDVVETDGAPPYAHAVTVQDLTSGSTSYSNDTSIQISFGPLSETPVQMQMAQSVDFVTNPTAWNPYSGISTYVTDGTQSSITVYARLQDANGNIGVPASTAIIIDYTPPGITNHMIGDDAWYSAYPASPYVNIDFSDTPASSASGSLLATAEYTIWTRSGTDTGTGTQVLPYTGLLNAPAALGVDSYSTNWDFNFNAATEGYNFISVRVYDNAENVTEVKDMFYFKKDTLPPASSDGYVSAWAASDTYHIPLMAVDNGSGVLNTYFCTYESGNPVCDPDPGADGIAGNTAQITCAAGNVCAKYVRYYSEDALLNEESDPVFPAPPYGIKTSQIVLLDLEAPSFATVTITPAQADSTTHVNDGDILNVGLADTFSDTAGFATGSGLNSCEYCLATDGTCDDAPGQEWFPANLAGGVCDTSGLTCTHGDAVTLSLRSTDNVGNIGTALPITRTCDGSEPACAFSGATETADNVHYNALVSPNIFYCTAAACGATADFEVTMTITDADSGVASATFDMSGSLLGAPACLGTTSGSADFDCSFAGVTSNFSGPITVRATDNVANSTDCTFLMQLDEDGPVDGTIEVVSSSLVNGYATDATIELDFATGDDGTGAGLRDWAITRLEYASGSLAYGQCSGAVVANPPDVALTSPDPNSNFTDSTVPDAICLDYRIRIYDNVNNFSDFSLPIAQAPVKVDMTEPVFSYVYDLYNLGQNQINDGWTMPYDPGGQDFDFTCSENAVSVIWSVNDGQSGIAQHHIQLNVGGGPATGPVIIQGIPTAQEPVRIQQLDGLTLLDGSSYSFTIQAANSAGLSLSNTSDGIVPDLLPPVLTFPAPAENAPPGSGIFSINALSADPHLYNSDLKYRSAPGTCFESRFEVISQSISCTSDTVCPTTDTYSNANWNANSIYTDTAIGTYGLSGDYEFVFTSTDRCGRTATATQAFTIQASDSIDEADKAIPANEWTMVALPLTPDTATAGNPPNPLLMYGNSSYKIWSWNQEFSPYNPYLSYYYYPGPGSCDSTPSAADKMCLGAGRGFWIRDLDGSLANYPGYTGYKSSQTCPVELKLSLGWNIIGTPYLWNYEIADLKFRRNNGSDVFSFDQAREGDWIAEALMAHDPANGWTFKTRADRLQPHTGYFLYSNMSDLTLIVDPVFDDTHGGSTTLTNPSAAAAARMAARRGGTARQYDFHLDLLATAAGVRDNANIIGGSSSAIDGYDSGDMIDPGHTPGPGYVALYFPHDNWNRTASRYTIDVHRTRTATGDTDSWPFTVETDLAGESVSVSWDPSHLALPYTFTLVHVETGNTVDMKEQSSYTYTVPADTSESYAQHFRVDIQVLQSIIIEPKPEPEPETEPPAPEDPAGDPVNSLTLDAGWNLLAPRSIQVAALIDSLNSLSQTQPIISIFQLNADKTLSRISSASLIAPDTGYWVYLNNSFNISVSGLPDATSAHETLAMQPGWTIIGTAVSDSRPWPQRLRFSCGGQDLSLDAAIQNRITEGVLYVFDQNQYKTLEPSAPLQPMRGYLLKTVGGCTLLVD